MLNFPPSPRLGKPRPNGTHPASARPGAAPGTRFELVCRLVAHELGVETELRDVSAAADSVSQKLSERLARLVSPAGSQAVLSRALHLARAEFPFLRMVHAGPKGQFDGLEATLPGVDAGQAEKGLVTVLTYFIDLLVGFIGEELTLRLVGEVWTGSRAREATPTEHIRRP